MRERYRANPEHMRQISYRYRMRNKEAYREQNARYRLKLKTVVLSHYGHGMPRCYCCGELNIEFLTLDHMDNDGKVDRLTTGGGHAAYRWLKSNSFPDRNFKIACFNCNAARYFYKKCPHRTQMAIADDPVAYLGEHL